MANASMDTLSAVRRDPAARQIVRAWRRLTTPARRARAGPGEPTLIACSGGADSTALVLALAASGAPVTVAHIVHDLRPAAEAHRDRDAVRALADRFGLSFVEASVRARAAGGNAEAQARRLRYEALARLAAEQGVRYIATAHHAHDQAETVLMHLIRGAGPAGLAGIAARRMLRAGAGGPAIVLIRPMLGVAPADARRFCSLAGVTWCEDATNADTSRLRAAIRADILPRLLTLRPGAAGRIGSSARVQGAAARALGAMAQALGPDKHGWDRAMLAAQPPAVLGEFVRRVVRAHRGGAGRDAVGERAINGLVRFVRSRATDPKVFALGVLRVRVTAHRVEVVQSPG